MSATAANISRATRRSQVVTLVDSDVRLRFPDARDALLNPDAGYFEDAADALSALAIKAALVGQFRRRFTVALAEEMPVNPLESIPTFELRAAELGFSGDMVVTRIVVDFENETTLLEGIG